MLEAAGYDYRCIYVCLRTRSHPRACSRSSSPQWHARHAVLQELLVPEHKIFSAYSTCSEKEKGTIAIFVRLLSSQLNLFPCAEPGGILFDALKPKRCWKPFDKSIPSLLRIISIETGDYSNRTRHIHYRINVL